MMIAQGLRGTMAATIGSGSRSAESVPNSPGPPKCKPLVVVKQLKPGSRVRVLCWVRERPPNSEAIAARLFNEAAEGWPEVVAIEAAVREGRL